MTERTVSEINAAHAIASGRAVARTSSTHNFRFNDIVFDVPPTDISVGHRGAIKQSSHLRSRHPSKIKSGQGVAYIDINICVLPIDMWKLHRLVTAFKYTPFWEIENQFVRTVMLPNVEGSPAMAACAESMSITTMQNHPETLKVHLTLSWFNYTPFTTTFSYKQDWTFQKDAKTKVTLFDIEQAGNDDPIVPQGFPASIVHNPANKIRKAEFLEFNDLSSPLVPHLPTPGVPAEYSNPYVHYMNWLQAQGMENDFHAAGAIDAVLASPAGLAKAIPYPHPKYSNSPIVIFRWREFIKLSENDALSQVLNKSFKRIEQTADLYEGTSGNSRANFDRPATRLNSTGWITGRRGTIYKNVGTPLHATGGIGRVSSSVGRRNSTRSGGSRNHAGTDLGWGGTTHAGQGIDLFSTIDGEVVYSTRFSRGSPSSSFGGFIVIKGTGQHEGLYTRHGHMEHGPKMIKPGDTVKVGDWIGNAGTSAADRGGGTSTHPIHHHLELWEDNYPYGPGSAASWNMDHENVRVTLEEEVGTVVDESHNADVPVVEEAGAHLDVDNNTIPVKKFSLEEPTADELAAANAELSAFSDQGWSLYRGTHVPPTLYRDKTLAVPATSNGNEPLIAAVWGVELMNRFAHLPIAGHEFPTAQYVGGQETRAFFQILDINTKRLPDSDTEDDNLRDGLSIYGRELFLMRDTLEVNARSFRTIEDSWMCEVDFIGAGLAGAPNWVISSMGTSSLPGNPGTYQISMELDASSAYEGGGLQNLNYDKSLVFRTLVEEIGKYIKDEQGFSRHEQIKGPGYLGLPMMELRSGWYNHHTNIAPVGDPFLREQVDQLMIYLMIGDYSFSDKFWGGRDPSELKQLDFYGLEKKMIPNFGQGKLELNSTDIIFPDVAVLFDSAFSHVESTDDRVGPYSDMLRVIMDTYINLTANKWGNTPGGSSINPAIALAERNAAAYKECQDFRKTRPSNDLAQLYFIHTRLDIEDAIADRYRSMLAGILDRIVKAAEDRDHPAFQKTLGVARSSIFSKIRGTYPDLPLPAHPIMGNPIMTPVDFYFWNPSEDGDVDTLDDSIPWRKQLALSVSNAWGSLRDLETGERLNSIDGKEIDRMASLDAKTGLKSSNSTGLIGGDAAAVAQAEANKLKAEFLAAEADFINQDTGRLPAKRVGKSDSQGNLDHDFGEDALINLTVESAQQLASEKFFLMRKAFPTFKLEFVNDNGEDGWSSLSDFYGYNAIKRITCTRSRKIPADLVIIELQNAGGVLDGSMAGSISDADYIGRETNNGALSGKAKTADARKLADSESALFESIILREGMDIRLRLGYSNNPEYLENVFNGRVLQVNWDENNDSVSIMAQSYAVELVAVEKGVTGEKKEGDGVLDNMTLSYSQGYVDTAELLATMMKSPEILHFGRFEFGALFQKGEASTPDFELAHSNRKSDHKIRTTIYHHPYRIKKLFAAVGDVMSGILNTVTLSAVGNYDFSDIGDFVGFGVGHNDLLLGKIDFKYKYRLLLNNPVDDNIFVPSADDLVAWTFRPPGADKKSSKTGNITLDDLLYFPMNTTVWDIFQEMGLRHPGWIASPVPYGRRMTMFFGIPSQRYWSKPVPKSYLSRMSDLREKIAETIDTNSTTIRADTNDALPTNYGPGGSVTMHKVFTAPKRGLHDLAELITEYTSGLAIRFKPFRRYHMASSRHNLMSNNIAASAYGVWNAVSVNYTKSGKANNDAVDDRAGTRKKKKAKGASWWKTLEMKAHNQIPAEDVLLESIDYFNCCGKPIATRYGVASIMRGLKDMYKGNVILVGNPRIKPYDIIFLVDEYNGISGPIEVEEVTHIFTPETGFISVVIPDAVVIGNEASSFPALVGLANGALLHLISKRMSGGVLKTLSVAAVASTAGSLAGLSSLGNSQEYKQWRGDPTKTRIAIQAAESVFAPTIADTYLNMYNYYLWAGQEIAVNVVPLMKEGDPWIAGIPNDLFDTGWDNFRGKASSALAHMARGRLATVIASQMHGYQVATAYDGEMKLKDKARTSRITGNE